MIDKVVSKNGMINLKLMLASCNCCIFCSISELCLEGRSIAFQFIYRLTVWIRLNNNNGVLVVDFPMFRSDDINWILGADGQYSVKSAYKAQFLGATALAARASVWKICPPPSYSEILRIACHLK
jgi:hypothetical protein